MELVWFGMLAAGTIPPPEEEVDEEEREDSFVSDVEGFSRGCVDVCCGRGMVCFVWVCFALGFGRMGLLRDWGEVSCLGGLWEVCCLVLGERVCSRP